MIDPGASNQVQGTTRLWVLPSAESDSSNPWRLVPGRTLVARVIEAQPGEAVLAWGRHRLPVRSEPPLNPGSTVVLQVHEASGQRIALRFLGTADQAGLLARAHPYSEFLLVLGLSDDPRNRSIIGALMRAGQAVSADEVRAVRQSMARLGASDDSAQAVAWLRRTGLPLNQVALDLARSLAQTQPTTAALWKTLWLRLSARSHRQQAAVPDQVAQLPLVQLAGRQPAPLASLLQQAVHSLALPLEAKLAEGTPARGAQDARVALQQMQGRTAGGDPEDPLDETIQQLKRRLEAQQLANSVRDGPLRIDLPLLVDGRLERATLLVHWQEQQRSEEGDPSTLHLELEVELATLGPIQVELIGRDGVLWCWVASDRDSTYRSLSEHAPQLAEGLERATGLPTRVQCLATLRRRTPEWATPVDVRT